MSTLHAMHPASPSSGLSAGAKSASSPASSSHPVGYSKMEPANGDYYHGSSNSHRHDHRRGHAENGSSRHSLAASGPPAPPPQMAPKPKRVDTQDLKSKLATALGNNGKRYWASLLDFMTAKIDRIEFEEEAMMCLKPQHVHLHNSLVLGLLFNASADVPGPSMSSKTNMTNRKRERDANGNLIDGDQVGGQSDDDDDDEQDQPINRVLGPPEKRLRMLAAGLSRKDRARIKNVPKSMTHSRGLASGATSSLGWAGAGADMLEKKRKEEEKRRIAEEKKRVKETYTQIGAKDWKGDVTSGSLQIAAVQERLSLSIQQEIARALAAPLCVESKELPDLDSLRDTMTLQAVEAGLPRGAQPQAAALLMAALQNHLQNVTSSIITKIRANRQMGIRTTNLHRIASDEYQLSPSTANVAVTQMQGIGEDDSFDSSTRLSPATRPLRTMASDLSSLSSSTTSLELHTGSSSSLADSSMISLVSTAPTSIPPASSSSSTEEAAGRNAAYAAKAGEQRRGGGGGGEEAEDDDDDEEDRDQVNSTASSDQRRESSIAGDNNSLQLRHLSFLLNLAPHTVVEPLGLGTQERLLASDWTAADDEALRESEWTSEGMLLRESRLAATSKMSSLPSPSTSSQRSTYIIDQLAPVRLFDRRTLAETQATHNTSSTTTTAGRSTKGGLSLPSRAATATAAAAANTAVEKAAATALDNNNKKEAGLEGEENRSMDSTVSSIFPSRSYATGHHHRGLDPHLYDVVDPVALLGSMVR